MRSRRCCPFPHDADRLHIAEVIPDILRGKAVLFALVLRLAETGLLVSHLAETSAIPQARPRHRFADLVDLCLVEFRDSLKGKVRGLNRVACLLLRNQIFVTHQTYHESRRGITVMTRHASAVLVVSSVIYLVLLRLPWIVELAA